MSDFSLAEPSLPTDKIWCEEVIIATTRRRGKGINSDPIRIITQVFLKDGTLIAEFDSHLNKKP